MLYINVPGGEDISDAQMAQQSNRIGNRIRRIREEHDPAMSQADLGEAVGLSADRIQQYENGFRKPKKELIKHIANALGVTSTALTDPDVSNYIGVMYALFEMEMLYNARPIEQNGNVCIEFDPNNHTMQQNLRMWLAQYNNLQAVLSSSQSLEEKQRALHKYHQWEWSYPPTISSAEMREQIENQIRLLQDQLHQLDDNQHDNTKS